MQAQLLQCLWKAKGTRQAAFTVDTEISSPRLSPAVQRTAGSSMRTWVEENIQPRNWLYTGEFICAGQLPSRGVERGSHMGWEKRGKQAYLMHLWSKTRILCRQAEAKRIFWLCFLREGSGRGRFVVLYSWSLLPNAKAFVHGENIDKLHCSTYSFTWEKKFSLNSLLAF